MIPLTCFKAYGNRGQSLAELFRECMAAYLCSREINYRVNDTKALIKAALARHVKQFLILHAAEGISLKFFGWCMSLRSSNTELFLRFNIEAQAVSALVAKQLHPIEAVIREMSKAAQVRVF